MFLRQRMSSGSEMSQFIVMKFHSRDREISCSWQKTATSSCSALLLT